jgi:sporulation protein YqfC
MKIKDRINNYLNDNEFRVTVFANKIDIINYTSILDFSSTEISVKVNNKIVIITGDDLVISKMYDDELLIKGKINNIKIT